MSGPLLFTAYTATMQDILKRNAVKYHKFADDPQIYTHPTILMTWNALLRDSVTASMRPNVAWFSINSS